VLAKLHAEVTRRSPRPKRGASSPRRLRPNHHALELRPWSAATNEKYGKLVRDLASSWIAANPGGRLEVFRIVVSVAFTARAGMILYVISSACPHHGPDGFANLAMECSPWRSYVLTTAISRFGAPFRSHSRSPSFLSQPPALSSSGSVFEALHGERSRAGPSPSADLHLGRRGTLRHGTLQQPVRRLSEGPVCAPRPHFPLTGYSSSSSARDGGLLWFASSARAGVPWCARR